MIKCCVGVNMVKADELSRRSHQNRAHLQQWKVATVTQRADMTQVVLLNDAFASALFDYLVKKVSLVYFIMVFCNLHFYLTDLLAVSSSKACSVNTARCSFFLIAVLVVGDYGSADLTACNLSMVPPRPTVTIEH